MVDLLGWGFPSTRVKMDAAVFGGASMEDGGIGSRFVWKDEDVLSDSCGGGGAFVIGVDVRGFLVRGGDGVL